ncbi:MAG: hypothetical protein GF417_01545 [Candidatus Latescibacteria bacterium]|nr:hypothetical protein [bacterium]MBD3423110.1 hypothetical protein [Candidatus Latescibacterota bacterium]
MPTASADASSGYIDSPSFFDTPDTSNTYSEFGYSLFDSNSGYLYSSSVGGRINERVTGRFSAYHFSLRRSNRILFGFGDFALNLTFRAAGDSTGSSGIFLRSDIRLPSGSSSLQPFANRSFDGGGGVELRTGFSALKLKMAGTYTFAGERNAEGPYPHSNYIVLAASAGLNMGRLCLSVSGYNIRYRKSGERRIMISELSGNIADNIKLALAGGIEGAEETERQYDTILSVRLSYAFPPPPSGE